MRPFEKGGAYIYCFAPVGMSVGQYVSWYPIHLVQLITQERFAPEALNLVGG